MAAVILAIADMVFPEPSLPDAAFLSGQLVGTSGFSRQIAGKPCFDLSPAGGEITVAFKQGPDAVHVIGKHHLCVDMEGAGPTGQANCGTQGVYFVDQ